MSNTKELKAILHKLLNEIEGLQANQVILSQHLADQPSIAVAREAKSLALQVNAVHFDKLRKQNEKLA
jgi:hypothetical protein